MENKIPQEIFNPVEENLKKLAELFPAAVKDGQVDFEALKQELGQFEEIGKEKYELTWPGKILAKQLALTDVVGKTLKYVPEESKNPDTTENLYIEGDNLEVLKLLRNSYYGKIKMIYIDPPYNTGNDFIYKDDFKKAKEESDKEEGEVDENGNRLIKNQRSSARFHSNWLNMMYPRLKVARDLLSDDGVIFISIDDNEVANLKKICDEIFGEENFVEIFSWVKTETPSNLSKKTKKSVEYILCYQKTDSDIKFIALPKKSMSDNPLIKPQNSIKVLTFKKDWLKVNLPNGIYKKGKYGTKKNTVEILNDFIVEDGKVDRDITIQARFVWTQTKLEEEIKNGTEIRIKTNSMILSYEKKEYEAESPWNIIDNRFGVGTNEDSEKEITSIFGLKVYDYPKPVSLLKYLLLFATQKDSIILDFFSGSATTAHAVMQLNAEDGGNRKFVMVQLPEPCPEDSEAYKAGFKTIADIGKERIRRAGEKIKEEFKDMEWIDQLDIGFKVFRVAETNIRWNDEVIKAEQITLDESTLSSKDALDFNPGFTDIDVVYEIMLRHRDFPLTSTIEKLTSIGERTYLFADSVVVCLEEMVTYEMVDKLAALEPKPIKIIFRDSAFDDDISLKLNILHRLDTLLKLHNQGKDQTYRVEFI